MKSAEKICALLLVALLLHLCVSAFAESTGTTVNEILKYGHLVLSMSGTEFLAHGYDYGDVVTVTVNGQEYEMPVGSNYSDVEQGSMLTRVVVKDDNSEDTLILAINMGDFAAAVGIATKEKTDADPGYIWHYLVDEPVAVSFAMKEKGGYRADWEINQLVRSENRDDYPNLTDEEFANFREIRTTGIGGGRLYRSSSPINPEINRNIIADAAARAAGIATVMNLADSEEVMKGYEGYVDTYYSSLQVILLNLGVDFSADDFKAELVEGYRFLSANEGPYLIHCNEGKDRAGFVSAILECLMGASADEVIADYMVSYHNYYNVEPGTEQYDSIARKNICKSLAIALNVDDIAAADLQSEAAEYLREIGLTEDEISALEAKLGT